MRGMGRNIVKTLMLAGVVSIFLCGCKKEEGKIGKVSIEECSFPEAEWQLDVTFPDWKGDVNAAFAVNNRVGFYCYEGQGKLYLSPDEKCDGFSIYVNGEKLDTGILVNGKEYVADISEITKNGLNSLQISNIGEGKVRAAIPYPIVIDGTPDEVGISEEAFKCIDRIITSDIENGFSSAQLAVVKDGRLVYNKAWGNVRTYDEKGNPIKSDPVTTETLYDLASNTKMYSVNYAIQHLLTNGEIELDKKICDILGEGFYEDTIKIDYEGYDAVSLDDNKRWKSELTVRDLLRHQGGFPPALQYFNDRYDNASQQFNSDNENILYVGTAGDEATRENTLKAIFGTPLMYEPGTQTIYSDIDYMLLCYCVEKITGQRMDDYLKETFFEPMGLEHITYNPLQNGFAKNDCAATELMGNSRDGNVDYSDIRTETIQGEVHDPNAFYCMAGVSGHAGLFSDASDLAKLASVMLTGGYGDKKFFSQDVRDMFVAPKNEAFTSYGLGWWREGDHVRDKYFGTVTSSDTYGHQGFTGTLTVIDPDKNLVVVILTNKIHSQLLEGDETLNQYKGNFYTTATLGFVSEILQIGMEDPDNCKEVLKSLEKDMAADAERRLREDGVTDEDHPEMRAYRSLQEIINK